MRPKLIALAAAAALVLAACGTAADPSPSPSSAVVAGAPDPTVDSPVSQPYSPTPDGLRFALPVAVESFRLVDSPPAIIADDRDELANDPLVKRQLIDRGLGPSVIDIVQRGDSFDRVPAISVTAVQFKGLDAADYSHMVASTYLLATSVDADQHNLTSAKPATFDAEIEGKAIRMADWITFDLAWYPHGDVLFIVLAENPQLMASALRSLPPMGGTS